MKALHFPSPWIVSRKADCGCLTSVQGLSVNKIGRCVQDEWKCGTDTPKWDNVSQHLRYVELFFIYLVINTEHAHIASLVSKQAF